MAKGPTYRIPVRDDHQSRMANKDALTGALWFGGITNPIGAAFGALVGGFFGKRHLKHQEEDGMVVKPPSFFNREMLLGGMIGLQAAVLPMAIATLLGASAVIAAPVTLFAAVAAVPLLALGSAIGAMTGKKKQKLAYEEAKAYVAANGEFNPKAQEMSAQAPGDLNAARQQMNPEQLAQLQALAAQGQSMAPAQPETQAQKLQHQHAQSNPQAGR